ncbi:LysR family substrate-binding domain-containing protein, partial [Pseudomonas aeruginosa]|nr:LysR family substrate-binding domain-containing protein [Pseudomonas aeruginosa]
QAQTKARAAANQRNTLRIALSGDMGQARLSALLALCREEAPQVGIRIFETPLAQLVTGLRNDLYDAGFALAGEMDAGIVAMPVWRDPLVVALPARHPLLAFKEVPLEEVASYPLVLCDPQVCEGCSRQRERLLRTVDAQPTVAEYV